MQASRCGPWDVQSDEDDVILPESPNKAQSVKEGRPADGTEQVNGRQDKTPDAKNPSQSASSVGEVLRHAHSWIQILQTIFEKELAELQDAPRLRVQTACSGTGCPVMGMKACCIFMSIAL